MAQKYDIISPRPGKDGKTFWIRIGAAFPSRDGNGFNISLDALPIPDKDGKVWLQMKEPRQRDEGQQSHDLDDNVPF